MLDDRSTITVLAEAANMPRGKAAQILRQAGVKRDAYRLHDSEQAMAALRAATDHSRASGHQLAGLGSDNGNAHLDQLASARAAAEQARAEKIRIELDQKKGLLISRADVLKASADFALSVRNGFLGLAPKIADACAHKSADDIARIADAIIRDALADLADTDRYALGEM